MPGKKARGFVQKESAPYLSSAALADNLPKMHEYQAEKEFVRTMMVLHRPLLLKKNKNALALKRLGLTLRQLVVLGVSKRAMEAAGINTAQLEPRWEPPAADNPRTAEAYRGKVDGTKVEGYAAYDAPVYHFRDERHIKERYIIAELPQYRTKAIPLHGRYRVRFRLNKDLTDSSRLIAGVVDRDVFRYFRNEKTWDRELYRDIYGLRCRKTPDRQGWSLTASGTPIYVQDPYAPFGKAGDIVDVIVDDAVPYPGYDDEFTRSCKTYINGKLRFEQVIDPYTLYWKLVPIVMAQDVDITLESVDELPTEGRLQAKGQLPTEGRLQAKGQLPTEGRLQEASTSRSSLWTSCRPKVGCRPKASCRPKVGCRPKASCRPKVGCRPKASCRPKVGCRPKASCRPKVGCRPKASCRPKVGCRPKASCRPKVGCRPKASCRPKVGCRPKASCRPPRARPRCACDSQHLCVRDVVLLAQPREPSRGSRRCPARRRRAGTRATSAVLRRAAS